MRITVDDGRTLDLILMGMATEAVLPPKNDMEGKQKLSLDNKPLFNARGLSAVRMMDGAPAGSDDSVTLSLTVQPEGGIQFAKIYKLSGKTTVTHYVQNNGRIGVSIVGTSIVAVNPAPANGGGAK